MIRVLVVDDDQGLRKTVSAALRNTGRFDVEEAFDGQDAIEQFENKEFDLVILDVDMPRKNGLETLKWIKAKDPRVISIILTAHATVDDAVTAVKEGAYHYLSKPIRSEDLLEMVENALEAQSLFS